MHIEHRVITQRHKNNLEIDQPIFEYYNYWLPSQQGGPQVTKMVARSELSGLLRGGLLVGAVWICVSLNRHAQLLPAPLGEGNNILLSPIIRDKSSGESSRARVGAMDARERRGVPGRAGTVFPPPPWKDLAGHPECARPRGPIHVSPRSWSRRKVPLESYSSLHGQGSERPLGRQE